MSVSPASRQSRDVAAVFLDQDLALRYGTRELDVPAAGEVTVCVSHAGICGSDLHVMATGDWVDYWPAVLGHEVSGTIVETAEVGAGDGTAVAGAGAQSPTSEAWPVGTRVVVDSRMPVRTTDSWQPADRFDPGLAWLGEARPGGFEEAFTIPTTSLHRVPDGLPLDAAVLAEPLAVVLSALTQVGGRTARTLATTTPAARVLILGYGPIGYLAHAAAQALWPAAEVAVSEPNPARSAVAGKHGARVLPSTGSADGYDLVVDAAGFPGSVDAAVNAAKRGATVLLIAIAHAPSELDAGNVVDKSVTIIGNNGFDTDDLDRTLKLIAADSERYTGVVSHRVPLAELPAFLHSDERLDERATAMKILIECEAR